MMKKTRIFTILGVFIVIICAITVFFYTNYRNSLFFLTLPKYSEATPTSSQGCPLCNQRITNPPLLVNTITGETKELKLYDQDRQNPTKIAEGSSYGVMSMERWSGGTLNAFPDNDFAYISIQKDTIYKYSHNIAENTFCTTHLKQIENINPKTNYIFADFFNSENVKYYDLSNLKDIRHYSFEIENNSKATYSLKMTSSYFDGGKDLDC